MHKCCIVTDHERRETKSRKSCSQLTKPRPVLPRWQFQSQSGSAFLPIRDISNDAGIVAEATPMIIIARGSVAHSGSGAIRAPTMPPNRTKIGVAVCPKLEPPPTLELFDKVADSRPIATRRQPDHCAPHDACWYPKRPANTDSSQQSNMTR